ncbi:helix-turn-helix transcriptional regulator [Alcanivorax hongdengensis]|nr:response regulator transcription factor [Alcanivorax hongdengensis]
MARNMRDGGNTYLVVSHCNNLAIRLLARSIETQRGTTCRAINRDDLFHDQIQDELVLVNVLDFSATELEQLLGKIQERKGLCRVILVNADRGDDIFFLLNWPVVKGVIYQQDNDALVSKAIEVVSRGRSWFPRSYMDYLVRHRKTPTRCGHIYESLTSRERQMLDHVVRGMSNHEIADALCLSTHTVKAHLQSLYRKVGVKNRVGVIRWVHDNHLEEGQEC